MAQFDFRNCAWRPMRTETLAQARQVLAVVSTGQKTVPIKTCRCHEVWCTYRCTCYLSSNTFRCSLRWFAFRSFQNSLIIHVQLLDALCLPLFTGAPLRLDMHVPQQRTHKLLIRQDEEFQSVHNWPELAHAFTVLNSKAVPHSGFAGAWCSDQRSPLAQLSVHRV